MSDFYKQDEDVFENTPDIEDVFAANEESSYYVNEEVQNPFKEESESQQYMGSPLDRTERQRQAEQRFQEPEFDIQGTLEKLPTLSKKTKKRIGVGIVFLIFLACAFSFISYLFGPKKAAEEYFEAVLDADWKKVYKKIEIPEGKLMSRKHFLDARAEVGPIEVSNLKVQDYSDNQGQTADFVKSCCVYYTLPGETQLKEENLMLIKQKERRLFFFPKWKISSGDMIVKNYTISAPSGYKLIVDGEELEPSETASAENGGYDIYYENIFAGKHVLEAYAEDREMMETTFLVDDNTSDDYSSGYTVEKLTVSQDAVEQMQSQVQNFMGQIYGDVINHYGVTEEYLSYWAIDGKNSDETQKIQQRASELYNNLEAELQNTNYSQIQFNSMNFSNYTSQMEEDYSDDVGNSYVRLYVTYDYDYSYMGLLTSYDGITSQEEVSDSGNSDTSVTFRMEEGEWKIYSVDLYSVY